MQYFPEIVAIETAMTLFVIWVLHYTISRREAFTLRVLAISSLLLTMMAGMFNAMTYYILYPSGFLTTVIAVNIAMFEMTVLIVVLLVLEDREKSISLRAGLSLSTLFIFNEVSMGIFLYFLANLSSLGNTLSFENALGFAMNNYLLIIPMIVEMLFLVFYVKPWGIYRIVFIYLIAMAAVNPLIIGKTSLEGYGILLNFAVMTSAMIIIVLKLIGEKSTIMVKDGFLVSILFALFALLSAGMLLGTYYGNAEIVYWIPYGVFSIFLMVFFYSVAILGLDKRDSKIEEVSGNTVMIFLSLIFFSSILSVLSIVSFYAPGIL